MLSLRKKAEPRPCFMEEGDAGTPRGRYHLAKGWLGTRCLETSLVSTFRTTTSLVEEDSPVSLKEAL